MRQPVMRWIVGFGIVIYVMVLLVLVGLVRASAATVSHVLEDTSPFFGTSINNKGHMAGQWCDGVTGCFPAIWYGPGNITVIGEGLGIAWSINNQDEAVYEGLDTQGNPGAWFWSATQGRIPLSRGATGYDQAVPLKLNDAKEIVGVLQNVHFAGACPVRWASPTSEPQCLTSFASNALLRALNESGVAAGFWQGDIDGQDLAFRHSASQGLQPIPFGVPVAINHKNTVLYEFSQVLLADGTLTDAVMVPDCVNTFGKDINNAGWILGSSDCPGGHRAWLRDGQGRLIDLTQAVNDPAWTIEFPFDLNELGEIAAWGMKDGVLRGVRLTPRLVSIVRAKLGR